MKHLSTDELRRMIVKNLYAIENRRHIEFLYRYTRKAAISEQQNKEQEETSELQDITHEINSQPVEDKENMRIPSFIKEVVRKVNETQKLDSTNRKEH